MKQRPKMILSLLAAVLIPTAGAQALLSLIEKGGRQSASVNRAAGFVELRDTSGREREYSVPYVAERAARTIAADLAANWKTYQDTLHWAMTVGLNSSSTALGTPHELRFTNCTLQLPADLTIAAGQTLSGSSWVKPDPDGIDLRPSHPGGEWARTLPAGGVEGWRDDGLTLENADVPRVERGRYCAYSSTTLIPDELTAYVPGVRVCTVFGCVATPRYPLPLSVNWGTLAARLQGVCTAANQSETADYQQQNLASLSRNAPLALHWNGVATVAGVRSGTTLAPFYAARSNQTSVTDIARTDARFPAYLRGALPADPSRVTTGGKTGIPELEVLKRSLEAGTLDEQESQGEAAFLQTWQQLDLVGDLRPLRYWAKALECGLASCTPLPVPLLTPATFVTPAGCSVPAAGPRTGTTGIRQFRYRWGVVSVPEGDALPKVVGRPLPRPDGE